MIFEDLPQDGNYVSTTADPLVPAVTFSGHSDYVMRGIANMKEALPRVLSCLPIERILFRNLFKTESHILGSTRMSTTPSEGVVDKHLRHHQYRNLFVLGSSAFTTYSPTNPTLTLSALSLWAADQSF
jgi:choline dehydrogenase-like flavoprotein